jgi:hypothetical protein
MTEPAVCIPSSGAKAPPPPLTAGLLYWLLVAFGLAVSVLGPPRELGDFVALWVSALLGTGLGQLLARGRLRPWLVALIVTNLVWFGFAMIAPFGWFGHLSEQWGAVELAVMTFMPAMICGYASLSERGGLVALWFPTALFMVPVLEGAGGRGELGTEDVWALVSILAVVFVAFLRARETRRVALWRRYATERLSLTLPTTILRKAPLRSLGQVGFVATTGALALAVTAWIAPHLWQKEKLASHPVRNPASQTFDHASSGHASTLAAAEWQPGVEAANRTCCPSREVEVERDRFKEYFPIHAHETSSHPSFAAGCVPCDEVATGPSVDRGSSFDVAFAGPGNAAPTSAYGSPASPGSTVADSVPRPAAPSPVLPPGPAPTPHVTPTVTAARAPLLSPESAVTETRMPVTPVMGKVEEVSPLAWLMTFAVCALGFELLLRPFRRGLMLRHLRSGLWREPADQRVSNLWQLALVGLRDAGFCPVLGEQPEELADRVGVPAMGTCATILERARHGVRVDAQDLERMKQDALSTYQAARQRIGWCARAFSWLRWPLV